MGTFWIIVFIVWAVVMLFSYSRNNKPKTKSDEEIAKERAAAAQLWDKVHEQQESEWKEEREKQYQQEQENLRRKKEEKPVVIEEDIKVEDVAAVKQEKKKPVKKRLTKEERRVKELKEMANEMFCDHWPEYDYSRLDPEQAERKLEKLKEEEGWIDDDQYSALIKIINGHIPETDLPSKMENAEPKELFEWYVEAYKKAKDGFSTKLMKEIGKKLKPYHEPMLLQELKEIEPVSVDDWVERKKKEGYFFSTKVYTSCKRKWLSQYDL